LFDDSLPSRSVHAFALGTLLALAAWTKQSSWPLIPALLAGVYFLSDWRTTSNALIGASLTSLFILLLSVVLENPYEMMRMALILPLHQVSATSIFSVILLFLKESWPVLILMTAHVVEIYHYRDFPPKSGRKYFFAKFLIALWMIPFAILTRTKLGADSNHLALPLFCILMTIATLLPGLADRIIFSQGGASPGILASLALLLLTGLALKPYLSTYCGWYLWNHNSQQQAMERLRHPHNGLYLPWQILPMLIVDGRLYHIDDCLRYENGMGWYRTHDSMARFLPYPLTSIAIRPFGAPSYLANQLLSRVNNDPLLPGWSIFQPRPILQ
jgi:hypothetical protein